MSETTTYKNLEAWKKSMDLVEVIYALTIHLPDEEKFGLFSQMRRAAVSIPSNIAEGYRRMSKADYAKFVTYSIGSGSELETQIEIVRRLRFAPTSMTSDSAKLLNEVLKILRGLHKSLV